MRIIPAHSSARRFTRLPKNTPIKQPAMEKANDTIPIMRMGQKMVNVSKPMQAKEIPTANASMLVATASVRMFFIRVGSKCGCSSSLKLSFIIRTPRIKSSPKAIQWS